MTLSVRLRSAGSLFALAISAAPLFAQTPQAGTVEVNAGVRVSDVGIKNFSTVTSPTGLLGLYLHRNFAIETEISSANGRVTNVPVGTRSVSSYTPIHLRGVFSIPVQEQVELLLGLGAVRTEQRWLEPNIPTGANSAQAVKKFNEYSWATMIGARLGLTDNIAFRAAVTVDGSRFSNDAGGEPDRTNRLFAGKRSTNIGGQFGVSYLFNTKPKDADGDGVRDKDDKCAATPAGVKVDATGCPLDSDRDGVADYQDKCANTPAGATVDSTGCPVDSDKDGVADYLDKCPNTPAGVQVDATGCPIDADGDGVSDAQDRCPNTPRGTRVNATGCPLDSDNDGVTDDLDRCPNTPAGTRVDASGCPVPVAVLDTVSKPLVLEGVNFATGSARLTPAGRTTLLRAVDLLKAAPTVRVEIDGHTDSQGTERANLRLSTARANTVKATLVAAGIDAARLETKGFGEGSPRATNRTAAGRGLNRRVELRPLR
ncbi:MAG TPA: OmpA family protein [Gemmatimonadaceae bacterium]|nr:OmpA family protein [Gemmatimonadaceae bacterium]